MNSITTALAILCAVTAFALLAIGFCIVTKQPIPEIVMTLLGVVLGFLGNHLASSQGASQALTNNVVKVPFPVDMSQPQQPLTPPQS